MQVVMMSWCGSAMPAPITPLWLSAMPVQLPWERLLQRPLSLLVCVCVCVRACGRVRVRVRVCACMRARMSQCGRYQIKFAPVLTKEMSAYH